MGNRTSIVRLAMIWVTVGIVMLSSACSERGRNTGDGPTPIASATTSPAEQVASVQQYAGLINTDIKRLRDLRQDWDDHDCFFEPKELPCPLYTLNADILAQTVVLALDGAAKRGVPAYIGKPPAEIERLVADTRAAAQRVDDAVPDDAAAAKPAEVDFAVSDLLRVFDRWDPYI